MRIAKLIGGLCSACLLALAAGFVGNLDYADALVIDAMEKEARVGRALSMPPAAPIFEDPADLLRLSPPVSCVRPEGVYDVGQEWIRSWGDGDLPPAVPACVRASYIAKEVS